MVFDMISGGIKKNNLTTGADKCIDISGGDTDKKYYKFSITKKHIEECKDF